MKILFILFIIAVVYLGIGIIVEYVNRSSRDDEMTFKAEDWKLFATWPKKVFGF